MPCYNDGLYIEESVQSVVDQTYKDIEIIIIDDGSDDNDTTVVLNRLENKDGCRVLHTEHVGVSEARNYGIAHAQGEYIMPLDSDDLIDPTYIDKAVDILRRHPNIGVVYCLADLFGEASGPWDLPRYSFKQILRDNILFITALFTKQIGKLLAGSIGI